MCGGVERWQRPEEKGGEWHMTAGRERRRVVCCGEKREEARGVRRRTETGGERRAAAGVTRSSSDWRQWLTVVAASGSGGVW
mmetsp:Transcript_23426/g.46682  ORF Transcript_23426/g.46682 Transcript_23426/m.46682 type:complete len:82 (-) Transcript_23426:201-446(-)